MSKNVSLRCINRICAAQFYYRMKDKNRMLVPIWLKTSKFDTDFQDECARVFVFEHDQDE